MGLILLDTNILADHFNGFKEAIIEISYHRHIAISSITYLEVAVGLHGANIAAFDLLIGNLPIAIFHPDDHIINEAISMRKASIAAHKAGIGRKIRTADAIILATANVTGRQLITRNPSDFHAAKIPVRVPYQVMNGIVSNVLLPPP